MERLTPMILERVAAEAAERVHEDHGLWPEFALRLTLTHVEARLEGAPYRAFELEEDEPPDADQLVDWLSEDPEEAAEVMRSRRLARLEEALPALEAAVAADPRLGALEEVSCEIEELGFWPRFRHEIEQEYARGYPPCAVVLRAEPDVELCVELEEDEVDPGVIVEGLRALL